MHRVLIAIAAVLGGALGYFVAFFIGINATVSSECDGPCFENWDEVGYIALAVGALSAIGTGWIVRSAVRQRLADRAKPPY